MTSSIPAVYHTPTRNVIIGCPSIKGYVFDTIIKHLKTHSTEQDSHIAHNYILMSPELVAYTMDSVFETIGALLVEVINTNNDDRHISADRKTHIPPVVMRYITDVTDDILEDTLDDSNSTKDGLYDRISYVIITAIMNTALSAYSEILPMIYGQLYTATTQYGGILEDVKIGSDDSVTLINLTIIK